MARDGNRRFYESRFIGARYARQSGLQPAEAEIIERYRRQVSGARILDLGVGGGRTTAFLAPLAGDYVGIDYSREMVERCRKRFPAARFEIADAADLSRFADASFDLIFFSYNGIDAATHEQRLRILGETRRLLAAGGLFIFSSHNRNFPVPRPWAIEHLAINPLRHPLRFLRRAAAFPLGIANYLRHSRRIETGPDHCIAIDSAYLYSLRHYCMTLEAQERQLASHGFRVVDRIGIDGRRVDRAESAAVADPWIQFVCRPEPRQRRGRLQAPAIM